MHRNNFDFLRLFFAILVVIHHCNPLSGTADQDALFYITNGKISLTYIGVRGFFIISGFLIFQSLLRSKDLLEYFTKRFLRIYPALIIVLLFTVFACALVYNGSPINYFTNIKTWSYAIVNLSMVKGQSIIPGVFENNPFKQVVNGSLWTIAYEMSMYFFIAPLYFLRKKSKAIMLIALLFMLLVLFTGRIFFIKELMSMHSVLMMDFWINFAILFMIGALFSLLEIEKIPYKIIALIAAVILFVVCLPLSYFEYIQYLLLPVIVILAGSGYIKEISSITEKTGDISYGTYIYGFIIQQLIMHFFALSSNELLFTSLPLTLFFGWLSWHFIEKHALSKKQIVYQKIKSYF